MVSVLSVGSKEQEKTMENKFKKFGGEEIANVGQYLREYLAKYPRTSIYVGTDSKSKKGGVVYATIIAMYDEIRKDGVHYIFKREREIGKLDIFSRMWREVEKSVEVAEYLEVELEGHLKRYDIEDLMVMRNPAGGVYRPNQNKLVAIDVDINPTLGDGKNLSNVAYEAAKGYVVGLGYRERFKPHAWASSCGADMLCKPSRKRSKSGKKKKRFAA